MNPAVLYFPAESYEKNRTRELRSMTWVAIANDLLPYVELVDRPNGAAIFGCYVTLVLIASRSKRRWYLLDNQGRPYSPETLARMARMPVELVGETIDLLLDLGMLTAGSSQDVAPNPQASATIPQRPAASSQDGAEIPHAHKRTLQDTAGHDTHHRTPQTPLDDFIERLYDRHPKKRNLPLVQSTIVRMSESWNGNATAMMAEIDRVHALWCETEDWKKHNGRYAPSLDQWLVDRGWTKEPDLW